MIGAIIFIAVCIITVLIIGIALIMDENTSKLQKGEGSFFIFIAGVCTFLLLILIFPKPSAIDVYRGKTTLEITETIRDSVVIDRDSVVVWREEIK